MEQKAFFDVTYGIFLLSTKVDTVMNGCITNTCMQVANNPVRFAISVLSSNYTCELIKRSHSFTVSILEESCPMTLIQHFGMQSGRDVHKFADQKYEIGNDGMPYLTEYVCSVIHGKVVETLELGTHTVFIGEAVDARKIGTGTPLTYSYYQEHIKPKQTKPKEDREIIGWRCKICNYVYAGKELPQDYICPLCGHGAEDFEPIYR